MNVETNKTTTDSINSNDYYVRAKAGKRFLNYLIDLILFYILATVVRVIKYLISPTFFQTIGNDSDSSPYNWIMSIILYAVYMATFETIFKGKSLGKLITGTRAVNLDGSKISMKTALERGFSRAAPFCVFSALGTPCIPWQDKWTNTMVVDERKSKKSKYFLY